MKYLAHIADDGREQTIAEHLRGTAELAAGFAAAFGAKADGYFAGLLHDIGKYTVGFQRRLHNGPPVDHATAGAREAFSRYGNVPAALAIAGHHGGIPDAGNPHDPPDEPTLLGRVKRLCTPDPVWMREISVAPPEPPAWLAANDLLQNAFYTRMLYSCLVDADFQDTQTFMDGTKAPRDGGASPADLLKCVRAQAQRFLCVQQPSLVTQQRNAALRACMERGQAWKQGLYTLTIPTGGGKTFASLAFALEHAVARHMDRVIYVIPYTSIIDQTVETFSDLLGEENVLAHYAGVDYQTVEPDEMTPEQYRKLLASENWDAPVVVTTAVQFFESLYANRSSRCRKLHNILIALSSLTKRKRSRRTICCRACRPSRSLCRITTRPPSSARRHSRRSARCFPGSRRGFPYKRSARTQTLCMKHFGAQCLPTSARSRARHCAAACAHTSRCSAWSTAAARRRSCLQPCRLREVIA